MLGLWLAVLWLLMTIRAQFLVQSWNEKLAALERLQGDMVKVFVTEEGQVPSSQGIPIHVLLITLVATFMFVWIVALIYSLLPLSRSVYPA